MNNVSEIILFLSMFEVSNKKIEKIAEIAKTKNIPSISAAIEDKEIVAQLSTNEYHSIVKDTAYESYKQNLARDNISYITRFDDDYPTMLYDLPDAPMILYYMGDLSLFEKDAIGVVGTREPSNYGRTITENFVRELSRAGFVIVSGLAYGVDSIAHTKCLDEGGKTIAVLGSGFNYIYPEAHHELAKEICQKGLLLSEYAPFVRATKYSFPKRNRIIAGLSRGILIPEAGTKSGTIHTKEYALEYGRDIFTIPGNITSPKSGLPNILIKSAQAECVTSPKDILDYYGVSAMEEKKVEYVNISLDEQLIISTLKNGELDFDQIQELTKISVNNLNSYLTTLEIRGLIRRMPAKKYALA